LGKRGSRSNRFTFHFPAMPAGSVAGMILTQADPGTTE
jgi:hypothetical protein